jgi:hypothetical protein
VNPVSFYKRLKNLLISAEVPKSSNPREKGFILDKTQTTIREIYVPGMGNKESWCDISTALRSQFEGKIRKYFGIDEDLSNYQIRCRTLGLELRKSEAKHGCGYVIVGNQGYFDRLQQMKVIYREFYDELKFDKEFNNEENRAGFHWEGVEK